MKKTWRLRLCAVLLLLPLSCNGLSLPGVGRVPGLGSQEVAIRLAFQSIEVLLKLVAVSIDLITAAVQRSRERQQRARTEADELYAGRCLAAPLIDADQRAAIGDLRAHGTLFTQGLALLTQGKAPDMRQLLVGLAFLVEGGVDRRLLQGALKAARTVRGILSLAPPRDGWSETAKVLDLAMIDYVSGVVQAALGDLDDASASFERALKARRGHYAQDHLCVALIEHHQAGLLAERGEYAQAAERYQRSIEVRLGDAELRREPGTIRALRDVGEFFTRIGRYADADRYYDRALEAAEQAQKPLLLADVKHGMGLAALRRGRHRDAQQDLTQALERREAACADVKAPELAAECHKDLTESHLALGDLSLRLGRTDDAEREYGLAERALSPDLSGRDPDGPIGKLRAVDRRLKARVLERRADALLSQGQQLGAVEALLAEAARTWEQLDGKRSAAGAGVLLRQGRLWLRRGDARRAAAVLGDAVAGLKRRLGKGHPQTGEAYAALAEACVALHRTRDAEVALAAAEAAFAGTDPFALGMVLIQRADLELSRGRKAEALAAVARAVAASERDPRLGLDSVDPTRVRALLQLLRRQEELAYALALDPLTRREALPLSFTLALSRKGRDLDEAVQARRDACAGERGRTASLCRDWEAVQQDLSDLNLEIYGCPDPELVGELQRRRVAKREQLRAITAQVDQQLPRLSQAKHVPAGKLAEDVLLALQREGGSALVEVVGVRGAGGPTYLAMVLRGDGKLFGVALDRRLEGQVEELQALLSKPPPRVGFAAALGRAKAVAGQVEGTLVEPLRGRLEGQRTVYLSLDGVLRNLPIHALYDPRRGRFLLEDDLRFVYLTSGRDLVRPTAPVRSPRLLAFVNPRFYAPPGAAVPSGSDSRASRPAGVQGVGLVPQLPATHEEGVRIQAVFPRAEVVEGEDVTKQALRGLDAPSVLHIATHGERLSDVRPAGEPAGGPAAGGPATRGVGLEDAPEERAPRARRSVARRADYADEVAGDPQLNMVLLLANGYMRAARADGGGRGTAPGLPPLQDVLMSALEVATLRLWGTQLVVLSACKLGLTQDRVTADGRQDQTVLGEGIYGMRRAVMLAGAESLVSGLWSVSDAVTAPLMGAFYERLGQGVARAEALRLAMKATMRRSPHPYYWAPFVLHGRPGALRSLEELKAPAAEPAE